ncbi:hypothetical protein E4U53_004208, partial [Claviceps sorghi]
MSSRPPSTLSVKPPPRSDSPIYLSSALIAPQDARHARRRFLDALGTGAPYPGTPRPIPSPDQLSEVQLRTCFDLLHACGQATHAGATRATTRASMDGFLNAVFKDWSCDAAELVRPEPEFTVEAEVVAGTIC